MRNLQSVLALSIPSHNSYNKAGFKWVSHSSTIIIEFFGAKIHLRIKYKADLSQSESVSIP